MWRNTGLCHSPSYYLPTKSPPTSDRTTRLQASESHTPTLFEIPVVGFLSLSNLARFPWSTTWLRPKLQCNLRSNRFAPSSTTPSSSSALRKKNSHLRASTTQYYAPSSTKLSALRLAALRLAALRLAAQLPSGQTQPCSQKPRSITLVANRSLGTSFWQSHDHRSVSLLPTGSGLSVFEQSSSHIPPQWRTSCPSPPL